jgi:hypothetical protein
VLAVAINTARGKRNEILEGVVVVHYTTYEFYPGLKDCHIKGMPYLLPNQRFYDEVPSTGDFNHLDRMWHASWKVKLRGDLSSIGRYGPQENYWRKLDVKYVIDARELDCNDENRDGIQ